MHRVRKRKNRNIRLRVLLVLALLVIVGGLWAAWNMKLTDITVIGSSYYTDEELLSRVFADARRYRTLYCMWSEKFGERESIPFVKSYDLTITGFHSARIVVYEKNLIGCIPYMGSYLYFDSEGYIVESSSELIDGVLFIDGINFDYFVMNYQLPVDDDDVFMQILVLGNLVEQEQLSVDKVCFDKSDNITMSIGQIDVYLGEGTDLESKIHTLADILPQIENEAGTLYLDNYATSGNTIEYVFKRSQIGQVDPSGNE